MRLKLLSHFKREIDVWSLSAWIIGLILLIPMIVVFSGLFSAGPKWEHLQDTVLKNYIFNTLVLVLSVTTIALCMAVPAAWLTSLYEFPGRRLFSWILVLPLAIPTYVAAFVYYQIPEAAIPLLVKIRLEFGVDAFLKAESFIRYGTVAVFMASVLFPYIFLTVRASFSQQGKHLVEAARTLGKSPTHTFFSIALPLARPAIFAGSILVTMEVVNDYGAVHLFGIPTMTEGIFRTWFGLEDRASAVRLAGLVISGVIILIITERSLRGRARFSDTNESARSRARIQLKGLRATAAVCLCISPLLIGLIYPLYQLVIWASRTWKDVFQPAFVGNLVNSVSLALITAGVMTLISLVLAYARSLHPVPFVKVMNRTASIGYAAPGAVIAIGVMVFLGNVDQAFALFSINSFLSGTLIAISFAYCVRFLSVSLGPVQSGCMRISGSYQEASFLLGRGKLTTLLRILIPLLRGTLIAAFVLVFVDILKELPLTMILRPANFETMATTAFSLASEGRIYECAVPSLILVLTSAIGLIAIHRLLDIPSK